MKHTHKVKMARKMMSKKERTTKGQRLFDTINWAERRDSIAQRVYKKVRLARERKMERLKLLNKQ